jgi:T-complex protein 1 subunit beta
VCLFVILSSIVVVVVTIIHLLLLCLFFQESRTVLGGGCSEMIMSTAVEELAKKTPGKKSMALSAFAAALRMLPTIIADNGGYDSSELISQLRSEHYNGNTTAGLDMRYGIVGNMEELGILEAYKSKLSVLTSATEAAGNSTIR